MLGRTALDFRRSIPEISMRGRRTSVKISLFLGIGDKKLLVGIVALSNVLENGIALPDDLVIVRVVDEGRDATVGVQLAILFRLVLLLCKVKDHLAVDVSVLAIGEPK